MGENWPKMTSNKSQTQVSNVGSNWVYNRFTVLGIPREEAADALLELHLSDKEIRGMIGMETQSMLCDDIDSAVGPPAAVLDKAIRHLLKERIVLQTQLDDTVRGKKKDAKKLEADLAAVEEQIVQLLRQGYLRALCAKLHSRRGQGRLLADRSARDRPCAHHAGCSCAHFRLLRRHLAAH
jgi:hypothetical protein